MRFFLKNGIMRLIIPKSHLMFHMALKCVLIGNVVSAETGGLLLFLPDLPRGMDAPFVVIRQR